MGAPPRLQVWEWKWRQNIENKFGQSGLPIISGIQHRFWGLAGALHVFCKRNSHLSSHSETLDAFALGSYFFAQSTLTLKMMAWDRTDFKMYLPEISWNYDSEFCHSGRRLDHAWSFFHLCAPLWIMYMVHSKRHMYSPPKSCFYKQRITWHRSLIVTPVVETSNKAGYMSM